MAKKIISAFILVLIFFGLGFYIYYGTSRTYKECFVEAGVPVSLEDFLKTQDYDAYFMEDSEEFDVNVPGDYKILIKVLGLTNRTTLHIRDTIPPEVVAKDVHLNFGDNCAPYDFIESVFDVTDTEISYSKSPDFEKAGQQNIEIVVTDEGDNETTVSAVLFISLVRPEIDVEAGSLPPDPKEFVVVGNEIITDEEYLASIDYGVLGDYEIALTVDHVDYVSVMHVVDTVPPVVTYKNVNSFTTLPRQAEDFIASAEDATDLTYRFENSPDVSKEGDQRLKIFVTDAGGNEVSSEVTLSLKVDNEAPVITGVKDIGAMIGSRISYKSGVTITDNCMERLSFTVDSSRVNSAVEGSYPITYIARDYSGNETRAEATVTIRAPRYDAETIYALADAVLARIITPGMSATDKCSAIYNYCKNNISYISHSEKGNWLKSAYEGFNNKRGDCYVYFSTAKALLTRAGVPNMDIEKIPSSTRHYWNLVDVGNGWVHFDTTPRRDRPYIFLWNDATLMDYSGRHGGSHNYDHERFNMVQ